MEQIDLGKTTDDDKQELQLAIHEYGEGCDNFLRQQQTENRKHQTRIVVTGGRGRMIGNARRDRDGMGWGNKRDTWGLGHEPQELNTAHPYRLAGSDHNDQGSTNQQGENKRSEIGYGADIRETTRARRRRGATRLGKITRRNVRK